MYKPINVYRDRTTVVALNVGIDVSNDVLTSQIRAELDGASELLATWVITHLTDGVDGKCIMTMDNSSIEDVVRSTGYMDVKRMVGGEPVALFSDPLPVVFKETITE